MAFTTTILDPREAIGPLLASRVIALDTEFKGDSPCRADLNGLSLAGGNPKDGMFAAFWPFGPYGEIAPWGWLRDRILLPILTDPTKLVVMHPWKVDVQLLHPRGIPESAIRCQKADTMAMAHITDENLPKGLKDLAWCLLGVSGVTSHAATQKEMKGLIRAGVKETKAVLRGVWNTYRHYRKAPSKRKGAPVLVVDSLEAEMPSRLTRWEREALKLPVGLKRADVLAAVAVGAKAAIEGDYTARAHARFARYGAEDALFTLGVYFALKAEMDPAHADLLALEQEVSHPIVSEMEETGLLVDVERLSAINDAMTEAVVRLREKVMREWEVTAEDVVVGKDGEWNPGSPDQVAQILWRKWKLRPPPWAVEDDQVKAKFARAKDGLCSTDKDVLRWLAQHAPAPFAGRIRDLNELRRYVKLQGKDVQGLLDLVMRDPEHRAHASFWPTGARTGRFTSDNPNVENIPRPTTMPTLAIPEGADAAKPPPGVDSVKDKKTGKVIWRIGSLRKVFIARPGWLVFAVDLSQIENRLMAHHSQDRNLLRLYRGWDCAVCSGSGETDQPLHACPSCGAKDGKRDKTQAEQPAVSGFCLGRDIHAFTAVRLGYVEKFGPDIGRDRGKCVSLNTIMMTDVGLKRLSDFVQPAWSQGTFRHTSPHLLWTLVPSGDMAPVSGAVYSGKKKSCVVVSRRAVLRCSLDHPIVLADGRCVRAGDIEQGARLLEVPVERAWLGVERSVNVNPFGDGTKYAMGPDVADDGPCVLTLDARWAYFAGVVAGDGSAHQGDGFNIAVGSGEEYAVWRETVLALCRSLGLPAVLSEKTDNIRLGSRRVGRFLRQLEMSGKHAKTLAIPWWVLQGSEECAWAYLAGVVDTDGTVGRGTGSVVSITSKHAEFVGELAFVARVLGLPVAVEPCWNKTYSRWYFRLRFAAGGLDKLNANLPLRSEKATLLRACAAQKRLRRTSKPDEVLLVMRVTTDGSDVRGRAASRLYVPDVDPIPMGDFEVDTEDHLYVPGGMATHNTTNHAATYGMSGPTMARRDDIPVRDAERGLAAWHETFPGVKPLHEEVQVLIRDQGYVEMFDGHRRRFPIANLLMRSGNFKPWEWEGVVREGTNVLCQGGTGIVVKRAMIASRNRLRTHENKAIRSIRLLNQVHDELVYESPAEVAAEGLAIVKWELEHAVQLRVPVIADGALGPTWGDAK